MLDQDQIAFYRTHGYLVVEDVLDQATILDPVRREYAAILDSLLDSWGLRAAPAAQLQRDEVRAHIGGTDWHQDRAVALEEADQTDMITVWVAVTDATTQNGCLQCAPNTARMLPHCPKKQTAIADGFLDTGRAVSVPVRSGGVVILHPLIPHSSLANHSDGIRWSFDLRFNRTGQPTGRAQFPDFVARSRAAPETQLRDWKKWRTMWEETRTRLAETPHFDIHRWQSNSPVCA